MTRLKTRIYIWLETAPASRDGSSRMLARLLARTCLAPRTAAVTAAARGGAGFCGGRALLAVDALLQQRHEIHDVGGRVLRHRRFFGRRAHHALGLDPRFDDLRE